MKVSAKIFSLLTLGLTLISLNACPAKSPTETPPPPSEFQEGSGEDGKIKATGTADTEEAPAPEAQESETQAETQAETQGEDSAQGCTYQADPASIDLEWTAYKTTDKVPVKGTFLTKDLAGPTSASSLKTLVEGLSLSIDGATIESGDPGRNATVKEFFFGKFNPPFKMKAAVAAMEGNDKEGNLTIAIDMNGVVKQVPFAYTVDETGLLTAKSGIDLMNWELKNAFDTIHKACEQLHTGKDGVSKTWEDVDLQIQGKFSKVNCPISN